MESIGWMVKAKREEMGLTLAKLASQVGVTKAYLSMIENGRVDNPPSRGLLEAIELALGFDDEGLQKVANWQVTPEPIRAEVRRLSDDAERGRKLAAWLKDNATKRKSGATGRDLDALYRSGQLGKRVNEVLRSDAPSRAEAVVAIHRIPLINKVAAGLPCEHTDLGFPEGTADEYLDVPGVDDPDAFATRISGESMLPEYREGDIVVCSPRADVVDGCDCFVRLEPDHESTFKRVFLDPDVGRIRLQPLNPKFPAKIAPREQVAGMFRAVARFSML